MSGRPNLPSNNRSRPFPLVSSFGRLNARYAATLFRVWMEEAGIQRTRRKMYHGHGVKDVTELYERHEVAAFLDSDADLLRQHLGDEKRHLEVVNT